MISKDNPDKDVEIPAADMDFPKHIVKVQPIVRNAEGGEEEGSGNEESMVASGSGEDISATTAPKNGGGLEENQDEKNFKFNNPDKPSSNNFWDY